ncbi:MAG: class I SAM-dependent methyltransferase [Halosimplex sp.]
MLDVELVGESLALRAFAGARRTEDQDLRVHARRFDTAPLCSVVLAVRRDRPRRVGGFTAEPGGPADRDERVRRTVATYERVANTYASVHGDDRESVADIVDRFVAALGERTDGTAHADEGPADAGDEATHAVEAGTHAGENARPWVLDVGCGPGWESATFAEAGVRPVPFDLTRSFLDQARERVPEAPPVRGDMRELAFADGAFDGLWACASLLHVPEAEVPATLAEFERALADGGVVCCSLKTTASDGGDGKGDGNGTASDDGGVGRSPYDDDRRHFERYDPERVRDLFAEAGFRAVDAETGSAANDSWVAVLARAE